MTVRALAEDVIRRYARRWKPGTLAASFALRQGETVLTGVALL